MNTTPKEIFDEMFNNIETEITFCKEWMGNLTGVLCGKHAISIPKNGAVKTIDYQDCKIIVINHGSAIVLISTDGYDIYSFESIKTNGVTVCKRTKLSIAEFHFLAVCVNNLKTTAKNKALEILEKVKLKSKLSPK
jgi:hypothetical protein